MSLELKFDPKTIEHLGVKMYSTLPPALAELISNAYDADATDVKIEFIEVNKQPKAIIIKDNGEGMSLEDIKTKFLVIGRNRRKEDGDKPSAKFGRLPTGKKGLGKLALFGLAEEVVVDTVKDGYKNRFLLNWNSLLASPSVYHPEIQVENQMVDENNRTYITLNKLKRKTPFDIEAIADSLSKIFVVGENFSIHLKNGEKTNLVSNERKMKLITPEFSWTESELIKEGDKYYGKLRLKLITSKTPIPPNTGLRGITLFSRGKLVNNPTYFSDSTSSHFYQYLTGSIDADFIDLLDEDVISTNRQALNWDHQEMQELYKYLSKLISQVSQQWRNLRAAKKEKEVKSITGIDKEKWLKTMPDDVKIHVDTILNEMTKNDEVMDVFKPVLQALHNIVPEYPELHWRHLHKSIKEDVQSYYENGQYDHAADQAVKIYAEIIRDLAEIQNDGYELGSVFMIREEKKSDKPVLVLFDNLHKSQSLANIQEGQGHLTRGVMMAFRNPMNHAPIKSVVPQLITQLDCLNILSLISYLAGRLEGAKKKDRSQEK